MAFPVFAYEGNAGEAVSASFAEKYPEWYAQDGSLSYPVTSESDEWADMSISEQREVCNVPTEILESLSDYDLLKIALDYPFVCDFMAFNSIEEGIEHLIETSSAFAELSTRDDLSNAMTELYSEIQVDYELIDDELDESDMYMKELLLEALIAREWDSDSFDEEQRSDILDEQVEKSSRRVAADSGASLDNFLLDCIINGKEVSTEETLSPASTSEGFIAGGAGVTLSNGGTYTGGVYQKYGTSASCYKYESGDFSSSEKTSINNTFSNKHSSWTYKSTATVKYNCHSYCWISNSYSNVYWLNSPSAHMSASSYFTAGSAGTSIKKGDYVVIYNSSGIAHSVIAQNASSGSGATSYRTTTKVISKIGSYGVYVSTLDSVYSFYSGTYYRPYTKKS